ncbi:MAG: Holliday junction resolvase RuvX [Candidatus Vogelbacteria bacterium]|nr:Holliday junction resolvase RuvX [Candidatus Vogelbacteria bacterium]
MRLMGIDFGMMRIGIALSDESGRFAFPHSIVSNDKNTLKTISKLAEKDRVNKIILGRSLDYQGQPNKIMKDIEIFKDKLEEIISLQVEYEDEFLTTVEAERIQGKNKNIDASAAALILKSYIDRHQNSAIL